MQFEKLKSLIMKNVWTSLCKSSKKLNKLAYLKKAYGSHKQRFSINNQVII